jgi:hypothetical protein
MSSSDAADQDRSELRGRIEKNAELVGSQLFRGLAEMLTEDPEALNLRVAILRAAGWLVDTLEVLLTDGVVAVCPLRAVTPEQRADEFVSAFADRVAEPRGLIVGSVARRASAHCAERLLSADSQIADPIEVGDVDARISGDLFCLIYALFFAGTVSEFLIGLVPDPCEEQEKLVDETRKVIQKSVDHEVCAGSILLRPIRRSAGAPAG